MLNCWCGNDVLTEYSVDYCKCEKCHTLISKHDFSSAVYDVNDEEADLYGKNYWEVEMKNVTGKSTLGEVVDMYLSERVIYWLKYVLKYAKLGAEVAEVGCGLGQLQYVLNQLGYQQLAFELSPEICNYMQTELGVRTNCGPFVEKRKSYDAILAFDLFEHLTEPANFVEMCKNSLKDNGIICFQTPCYDAELNYEQMIASKGRFVDQLKSEQHIYLYSREAITRILKEGGFEHIVFEPACFGDDYDMFLFAAEKPIRENTEKEIDDYLNSVPNGRLVKVMIKLFDERNEIESQYQNADSDRNKRFEQCKELERLLKESEEDRASRKEQIEKLTEMLKESETDRASRKEQIEKLTEMLKESEEDRASRKEQIEKLTEMLKESEEDRASRKEQIEKLTGMLRESEADRVACQKQIEKLTEMLRESESDRGARQEQIDKLTKMLLESEEDRAARLVQIETLTEMLQHTNKDEERPE